MDRRRGLLAIQVHGGMGYVEETGVAQHWRDSRIAPIYEGTNGIQAIDLVERKVRRDGGIAMAALLHDIDDVQRALAAVPELLDIARELEASVATQLASPSRSRLTSGWPL